MKKMERWQAIKKSYEKGWRVAYSSAWGFWEDDCYTKASILTFYTLQSIVPFLAAVLAIAKGFGFDEYLEKVLAITFSEQKEILNYAIQIALSLLNFISSGEIVGVGAILLLWTNINLVGYVELALNEIWKVKISRSLFQKIKDFSFAVVVFPLIFVASSSATLYVKAQISSLSYFAPLNQLVFHELKALIPWILSCFLFGAVYFLIPNAKLRVVPRLIASVVAGTAFQLWQVVFINLQVYIFSYNIVYGAFALLPLFLIWLQFSWMIVLAGAEISARLEDYTSRKEMFDKGVIKISQCELALLILNECMATFYLGNAPLSSVRLSDELGVSPDPLEELLAVLEKEKVLISFYSKEGELCYHLLNDPSRFKILSIIDMIEHRFENEIAVESSERVVKARQVLQALHQASQDSLSNVTLNEFFKAH